MERRVSSWRSRSSQPPLPAKPRSGKNSKAVNWLARANSNGSSTEAAANEVWLPILIVPIFFIVQSYLGPRLHDVQPAFGERALDILRRAEGLLESASDADYVTGKLLAEDRIPHQWVGGIVEGYFARWVQEHAVVKPRTSVPGQVLGVRIRAENQTAPV